MSKKMLDLLHLKGILEPTDEEKSDNQLFPGFEKRDGIFQRNLKLPFVSSDRDFFSGGHLQLPFLRESVPTAELRFFDLETTGLHTCSGSIAFLAGIGRIDNEAMFLTQYLLSGPGAESRMIALVAEDLENRWLVTYNGKSYDLPLLRSRLIFLKRLNGGGVLNDNFETTGHIDLLQISRALYRDILPGLRLTMMEHYLLNESREGDVDGCDIPDIYFSWLRDRISEPMLPVIEHNQHDIFSLARLLAAVSTVFEARSSVGLNTVSSSRFLLRQGRKDVALSLLVDGYQRGEKESMKLLSLLYKRNGELSDAVMVWNDAITAMELFDPFPYVELAKFYEHKVKQFGLALGIVNEALERIEVERAMQRFFDITILEDLLKRRERIIKKKARMQALHKNI